MELLQDYRKQINAFVKAMNAARVAYSLTPAVRDVFLGALDLPGKFRTLPEQLMMFIAARGIDVAMDLLEEFLNPVSMTKQASPAPTTKAIE